MFVSEIFEAKEKKILVIYPGRFQPFHKGHHSVYNHLCEKYGNDNVFICTSDKVDPLKSPFSFNEKKKMMILTGVNPSNIIFDAQPYQAKEFVSKFDSNNTILIFAISEKDMAEDPRFKFGVKKDGTPTYFQPLKDINQCKTLNQHAYMATVPTFDFEVLGKPANSATQIRAQFESADEATQKKIVTDLFGKFDPTVYKIMRDKLIAEAASNFPKFDIESIEKHFGTIYPTSTIVEGENVNIYNLNHKLFNHLMDPSRKNGLHTFYQVLVQKRLKECNIPITENIELDTSTKSLFDLFSTFKTENTVKVGDKISIIELTAWHLGGNSPKEIYLDGFISPKEVTNIGHEHTIIDGMSWPNTDDIVNQSKFIKQIIFFHNQSDAKKCLTAISLFGNKVGDWSIENQIQEHRDTENINEETNAEELTRLQQRLKGAFERRDYNLINYLKLEIKKLNGEIESRSRNKITEMSEQNQVELRFTTRNITDLDELYSHIRNNANSLFEHGEIDEDSYYGHSLPDGSWKMEFAKRISPGLRRLTNETLQYSDIKSFINRLKEIDLSENSKISIGQQLSVLRFDIIFAFEEVEVTGFTIPKTITDIQLSPDKTIKLITFADGDTYPRLENVTYHGKPTSYSSFFRSQHDAEAALTMLHLALPADWAIIENNVILPHNEKDITEDSSQMSDSDLLNPDPKIRSLAKQVVLMKKELNNLVSNNAS